MKQHLAGISIIIYISLRIRSYITKSKASSSHSSACIAARKFGGKVHVIDSKALSTGQGLLVLKACDLRDEGMSAEDIAARIRALEAQKKTYAAQLDALGERRKSLAAAVETPRRNGGEWKARQSGRSDRADFRLLCAFTF